MQTHRPQTRLHALDAVRAVALLSGIALHSALSYAPGVDSQLWPLRDSQQSVGMSVFVFLIHMFRMPVFFLLAGFFAHQMFHRQGTLGFLRNRASRILLPLVLGWIVCFLSIAGVVLWHLMRMNGGQMPQSVPPEFAKAGLNFLHLWFLYILCWLYAVVLLLRWVIHAIDRNNALVHLADRIIRDAWVSPIKSLLLAVPIICALLLQTDWAWWFGIPTPAYSVIPPVLPLFIYGYLFALGWMLNRQRALLENLGSSWLIRLLLGLGAAMVCLVMAGPEASVQGVHAAPVKLLCYAALYGIAIISLAMAFIGLGIRCFATASPRIRYVSDASYWMYIAHLPVVMAIQVVLMPLELHWAIKFVTVNVATCAVLLLAYRYGVRSSWIGLMLNGRR
jgi:glucans biosynthesis protein C